jgi:hypothetical protein
MKLRSAALLVSVIVTLSPRLQAFPHVVRPGETLAEIATQVYGDPRKETLLAGANALDVGGGSAIVAGMRLEIPAPLHHSVALGETWESLAEIWLGSGVRSDLLARTNDAVPWIEPERGLEIEIPAVVAHIVSEGDNSTSLAARFWGDGNRGWELNAFNGRREEPMHRGEIILVPLPRLKLTDAGVAEAREALHVAQSQVALAGLETQRRSDAAIPLLLADIGAGRYVEAIGLGNRLLGSGELRRSKLVILHRALLEAYVALDAAAEASQACASLLANDGGHVLDPTTTSPKVRAACAR